MIYLFHRNLFVDNIDNSDNDFNAFFCLRILLQEITDQMNCSSSDNNNGILGANNEKSNDTNKTRQQRGTGHVTSISRVASKLT